MGTDGTGPGLFTAQPSHSALAERRLTPNAVWVESPLRHDELDVYWHPRQHPDNRYPVGFNVYRLKTPQMRFTSPGAVKLNTTLVTIPLFRDLAAPTRRRDHVYYVVTEEFDDGTELSLSDPVTIGLGFNPPGRRRKNISMPRIYQEFRRRKYLILENTAEMVDLLIRKKSGTRCPCFNCEYEASESTRCADCFGVGFQGGFELLRDVLCRVMNINEVLSLQPQGIVFKTNPRGWLVDFPLLRNGDVVVRRNGDRVEVNAVDYMYHQGILTHQDFDLIDLPTNSVIYDFLIPDSATPTP